MAIDAIGIVSNPAESMPRNAIVSQEAFLKILLTQLRFQDPLKPMDNQEFMAQLAQFSAIEINRQQSEKVDSLLNIQATNQAIALVGKRVELRGGYAGLEGGVTAVSFPNGEARLTVNIGSPTDPANPGTVITNVKLSDIVLVR